jgi:hypothetical protein
MFHFGHRIDPIADAVRPATVATSARVIFAFLISLAVSVPATAWTLAMLGAASRADDAVDASASSAV